MPRTKSKLKTRKNLKTVTKAKRTPVRRTRIASRRQNPTLRKVEIAKNKGPWAESYISLLLGVVFVVVGVIALASFFRNNHSKQITATSIQLTATPKVTAAQNTPTPTQMPVKPNVKTYIVKPNDDLWHIAEKVYGSGYNYVDIARANHLTNPSTIFTGDKLVIPQNVQKEPSTIITPTPLTTNQSAIDSNTYIVQKGDDLWDIAVRAYANGYKWVDIAKANNLTNPGLIFKGDVLKIPR